VLATCVVVCALSTFISAQETLRAFDRGVRTTDTLFIPKWWLLAPVVYGLGSSTLHFARRLALPDRGFASIGYGLPGAMGAALAAPGRTVVSLTGARR
jgi:hypothetical protein